MTDALFALKQLYVVLLGLGMLLGLLSRRQVAGALGALFLKMLALAVLLPVLAALWQATPGALRGAALAVGVPLALLGALLASGFGREVAAGVVSNALYDGARSRAGCGGCLGVLLLLFLLGLFAF